MMRPEKFLLEEESRRKMGKLIMWDGLPETHFIERDHLGLISF